jgi:predicted nucleic acid-binding protein
LNYLLDTNVVSEWVKTPPDANVVRWFAATDEQSMWMSVMTFAEIRFGVARLVGGIRQDSLLAWLQNDLPTRFDGRIISVGLAVADAWGVIMAKSWALGTPLAVMDAFLAATAEAHDMTLVTRNTRHFENLGIPLLNPWIGGA